VFVKRFVLVRAENLGEIFGQQTAQREIRIRYGQRTQLLVTRGSRQCPRTFRPDHEKARPEEKHRSTARRDCVDVQLQFNFHLSKKLESSLAFHGLTQLSRAIMLPYSKTMKSHEMLEERFKPEEPV